MSSPSFPEPRRYLIAIGSSCCPDMGLPKLEHIESDIRRVTDLFVAQGYERVLSDQIVLDDTSGQVKNAISRWFASPERQSLDCVVIYYGGHGDEVGHFPHHYLFTRDSIEDRIGTTAIKTRDLVECLFPVNKDTSPQNVLLILDTCYANVGGRQISQVLSELKGTAPPSSGFWVISSSDANTEAGDGAFVESLCTVLHPERTEWQHDGEFLPIETLISRINNHFETTEQAQRAIADGRGIQQTTRFFRNPCDRLPQPAASLTSPGQRLLLPQLVDCLGKLDYKPQTRVFEDAIPRSPRVAAFVVQARDRRIQEWLVKRLFNQLPNVRNARVFSFVIPAHPLWKHRDFDELWMDFARQLRCKAQSTVVLDELVKIYQTQPLILAMYGWQESKRSQQLQQQVLTEFWQPLVQRIKDFPNQPRRSRLVLFLAEGATQAPEVKEDIQHPIRLAPLTQISHDDVADWFDNQQVAPLLQQLRSEESITMLIEQEIDEWNPDPVETLQQICYVFELDNGLGEIESEWRLVG